MEFQGKKVQVRELDQKYNFEFSSPELFKKWLHLSSSGNKSTSWNTKQLQSKYLIASTYPALKTAALNKEINNFGNKSKTYEQKATSLDDLI